MKPYICLFVIAIVSSGCAHRQVRFNLNEQAISVHHTIEQQVLDNLAMFCVEGDGVPFLSVPDEGASNVDDTGSIEGGAPLNPFFTTLGFDRNRSTGNSWTLKPVVSKSQLAAIRELLRGNICILNRSTNRSDIPRCCTRYGRYCGHYVWVRDGYESQFADLVLDILGAASGIKADATKLVTVYISEEGTAVPKEDSVGSVEMEIAYNAHPVKSALQISGEKIDNGERFIPDAMLQHINRLKTIQRLDAAGGTGSRRRTP